MCDYDEPYHLDPLLSWLVLGDTGFYVKSTGDCYVCAEGHVAMHSVVATADLAATNCVAGPCTTMSIEYQGDDHYDHHDDSPQTPHFESHTVTTHSFAAHVSI